MALDVAVVGAGHWGPHLIRNFDDHLESRTTWIVERDDGRRAGLEQRFPRSKTTADISDVLADPEVDAVAIATPTSTHFDLARAALDAGKHVLVEKPITDSLAEATALCELAEQNELVLMVGHVFLFNPAVRAAKASIDRSELGEVRYLSMTRTNLGPVRTDVGASWDLASHDISIANYWLESMPLRVSASGGSWLNEGIQDVVFATLEYPDDVLVHIEASWLNPRKRRLISVVGTDRMLTVDDMDLTEPLRIYDKGVVDAAADITDTFAGFRAKVREGQVVIPHVTTGEPLRLECESFLLRVMGKEDNTSDGWLGAGVVAVLEAIDRSMQAAGASEPVEALR